MATDFVFILLLCSVSLDKIYARTLHHHSDSAGITKSNDYQSIYEIRHHLQSTKSAIDPLHLKKSIKEQLPDDLGFENRKLESDVNGRDLFKRILVNKAAPPWFNGRTGRRDIRAKQKLDPFQILVEYLKDIKRRGKRLRRR